MDRAIAASHRSRSPCADALRAACLRVLIAAATCGWIGASSLRAEEDPSARPVRVRIAWGGGESSRWSGRLTLSDGSFADPQLLGMEADAAAAVHASERDIVVDSLSRRRFDGVDVTVSATATATLAVEMRSDAATTPVQADIPLAQALRLPMEGNAAVGGSGFVLPLDQRGNKLIVERAPGDSLRIVTRRDVLIFAPGEQFTFDVRPLVSEIAPGTTIDIEASLSPARRTRALWNFSQHLPVPVNGPPVATFHVPLPREEGVYRIRLAVSRPAGFRDRFLPGGAPAPLAERSFQVVVLEAAPAAPVPDAKWQTVLEIDPANPTWWERLPDWTQIRRIPGIPRRPLGSFRAVAVSHSLGNFVELPPTAAGGEPHWQAYPLPLETIGAPHLLEIAYPNDQEQHLGISIIEPNAAGQAVPIGRDTGAYVEGLGHAERIEMRKHQMVFWPRTNAPLLLVTNQHPTAAARFGTVRVQRRSTGTIAAEPWPKSADGGRLVAAYLSRPLLPETFGASEGLDALSGQSVDDWQTFYEASVRMAEYLNYAGYNAAVVNVLADGSALYPSRHVRSTPFYNTGRMIAGAADLPPVDATELLHRVCDRSGLAFVPALQFATPLTRLEAERRGGDPQVSGIELVGPDGRTWLETHGTDRGLAPYYNLLDDRVQQAMLDVVRDYVNRYGSHPSFAGLTVQLSGRGYALVPGLEWGLDDATVGRFGRETGIVLPGEGPGRFSARQALLAGEHAEAWRAWRAARVTAFYRELAAIVASQDRRRRLVLTTEELFATPGLTARLRPNVAAKPRIDRTMLDLGIDREALRQLPGVAVCPTQYVESMVPLVDRAVDLAINDAFAASHKRSVDPSATAAMLFHRPQRTSLPSFDARSPYHSHTLLVSQSLADGAAARRPYVATLVNQDPAVLIDGGELLPQGQEDATRRLRAVLRALPPTPADIRRGQNVTVRTYPAAEQTICTVVNECPWHAEVRIDLSLPRPAQARPLVNDAGAASPATVQDFAAGRHIWALRLAPYDVYAVRFDASGVQIGGVAGEISESGRRELAVRVADLRERDLTKPAIFIGLENADFEPAANDGSPVAGWRLTGSPTGAKAELDATAPQQGKTCLYLENRDPNGTAILDSNWFTTPPTGQLVMVAFVRGQRVDPRTELRLAFEIERGGKSYRQSAILGGMRPGVPQLDAQWLPYRFGSEELPLDSRARMRVKFELAGSGEVWIDHVQLYDVLFPLPFYEHSERERLKLVTIMHAAGSALDKGNLSECVTLLEGYWPRFLTAYTPLTPPAVVQPKPPPNAVAPADPNRNKEEEAPSVSGWKGWLTWPWR